MNRFKDYIKEISGLRFVFENLKINSVAGRNFLLETEFIVNSGTLAEEFNNLEYTYDFFYNNLENNEISDIALKLHQLNDISVTLKNLGKGGVVLDDIQLFEIKKFAILSQQITSVILKKGFDLFRFANLSEMLKVLDPNNTGESSFYIYSVYSEELLKLRAEQQKEQIRGTEKAEELRIKCIEIEDEIRKKLSKELRSYITHLSDNFNKLAYLDVLIAKSIHVKEYNLCKPSISDKVTEYKKVFHPEIQSVLNQQSKEFQAVDISFADEPNLITGANMSGKTVLLKTLALAQYLFQFGFYIPAQKASIVPVDNIMMSVGDNQSELNGLSSFAVEMLNINQIISETKKGHNVLALVDELARTTNPDEGKKIVNAFVEIMSELKVRSLITTHYSGVAKDCRKLRVAGLRLKNNEEKITVDNINEFMDYSLIETKSDEAPKEAIKIAEILEVDETFLKLIKK